MRPIPDSWSDRMPQNMSVKRRVILFRQLFHQELLEHGFVCHGDEMPTESRPKGQPLASLCQYYRAVGDGLFQIVTCSLLQLEDALSEGRYVGYVYTGGKISVNTLSLYDMLPYYLTHSPVYYYEARNGYSQQYFVGFRFPGMEEGFCDSFINLYCDDRAFALELEKELFFEQTLPKLDQINTQEKYAQWRWDVFNHSSDQRNPAEEAVWAQLKTHRWDAMAACVNAMQGKLDITRRLLKDKEIDPRCERKIRLEELAQTKDEKLADDILQANYKDNLAIIQKQAPKLYALMIR